MLCESYHIRFGSCCCDFDIFWGLINFLDCCFHDSIYAGPQYRMCRLVWEWSPKQWARVFFAWTFCVECVLEYFLPEPPAWSVGWSIFCPRFVCGVCARVFFCPNFVCGVCARVFFAPTLCVEYVLEYLLPPNSVPPTNKQTALTKGWPTQTSDRLGVNR